MAEYRKNDELSNKLREVHDLFEHLGKSNRDIADLAEDLRICVDTKIIDPEMYERLEPYKGQKLVAALCEYNR